MSDIQFGDHQIESYVQFPRVSGGIFEFLIIDSNGLAGEVEIRPIMHSHLQDFRLRHTVFIIDTSEFLVFELLVQLVEFWFKLTKGWNAKYLEWFGGNYFEFSTFDYKTQS